MIHPKQICSDIESMGAKLVLDQGELYVENDNQLYDDLIEFIKSYKVRIIKFLNGKYTDDEHKVRQTMDKIIMFYREDCPEDSKINQWLQQDIKAGHMIMQLTVLLADNGWKYKEPIANYEDEESDRLSQNIYDRAMYFFKKGAVLDE